MRCDSVSGKIQLNLVGGFTLVELLIAMAVGLVVLGAAQRNFIVQRKVYAKQDQATEMLQNARAAVDFMERELRSANSISALDSTNCNSNITYVSVLVPAQPRGFSRSSSSNTCSSNNLEYTQGGSTQPLAENVSCLTIVQGGSLFTITLTARTCAKDPDLHDYRSITISSQVRARCIPTGPANTACS